MAGTPGAAYVSALHRLVTGKSPTAVQASVPVFILIELPRNRRVCSKHDADVPMARLVVPGRDGSVVRGPAAELFGTCEVRETGAKIQIGIRAPVPHMSEAFDSLGFRI